MDYVKKLEFNERPDYKYLKKLFGKIMKDNNFKYDYVFD